MVVRALRKHQLNFKATSRSREMLFYHGKFIVGRLEFRRQSEVLEDPDVTGTKERESLQETRVP
jgi:hypothetical protein